MAVVRNPAIESFVAQIGPELILAQVLILRGERGFELRHVADRARGSADLRIVPIPELRSISQLTANGAFRPLKSAPNLQHGWRTVIANSLELDLALQQLYPNAVADWFAAQKSEPPVTHYREFTNRQTGMYRVTQLLDDQQVAQVTRACCHPCVCLKRRLWSGVAGLEADPADTKSLILCLEPCAILLEFARTIARMEQSPRVETCQPIENLSTSAANLEQALEEPNPDCREADFNAPSNPRRLLFALEKLQSAATLAGSIDGK